MNYYQHGPDGQIVMICQLCRTRHHDEPKQVYVEDPAASKQAGKPVYRQARCKMCLCHDCLQLADDPVRRELAKQVMGQEIARPFNLEHAIGGVAEALGIGLVPERPPERHGLRQDVTCGCGAAPKIRCMNCEVVLCMKCLRKHRCARGR